MDLLKKNTFFLGGDLTNKLNYINLLGLLYLFSHVHIKTPYETMVDGMSSEISPGKNGHRSMFFIGKMKINHRKNHGKTIGFGVALYVYPLLLD